MTKEEASDLKSLQDRVVQTELEFQQATQAKTRAAGDLERMMWTLQNPPKRAHRRVKPVEAK